MGLVGFESAPRYRELLYKLISEDLEFPPPGFIIELDRPEWAYLKDESLWATQPLAQGPVAAQSSFVQVRNPAGSQRLVVVTHYYAFRTTAGTVSIALTNTPRGATGGAVAILRDQRATLPVAINRPDPLIVEGGTAAVFTGDVQIFNFTVPALTWTQLPFPPIVCGPGLGVNITSGTLNEQLQVEMAGYSRSARPEEVTP